MMQLIVNDQQVYLGDDFSIRLEMVFPAFEEEFEYSSLTYPFSIPAASNEELFNFSNHVVVNNKLRLYDCQVIFAGSIRFAAKLVLSKLNANKFQGSVIMNRFSTDYRDLLLNEFDYDGDISLGTTSTDVVAHANGKAAHTDPGPDLKYNFPEIKAPQFYGDENEENPAFCGILNRWDRGNQSFQLNVIGTDLDGQNTESLLPCPYLLYVLQKCFDESGYRIFGSFLNDPEIQSLLMLNNYPLDLLEKLYYVRANNTSIQADIQEEYILANDDFTAPNEDNWDIWNKTRYGWSYTISSKGWHSVDMDFKAKYDGLGVNENVVARINLVKLNDGNPQVVKTKDIRLAFANTWYEKSVSFNYYFEAGDITDKFSLEIHFIDTITLDDDRGDFQCLDLVIMATSASGLNSFSKSLHLANHVPGISLGDMMNALKKGFGTCCFYGHDFKEIQFSTLQEIIDSESFLDLSDNVIARSEEIELKDAEGYLLNFEFDSNDDVTQDNFVDASAYDYIGEFDTYADLPTPTGLNKVALVLNTNRLYFYGIEDSESASWKVFSDNYYDYLVGDGGDEIKIGFSPVMMHHDMEDDPESITIRPITKLTASSPGFGTGMNDFGFQLMFYRGLQEDLDDEYPLASSMSFGPSGEDLGDIELQLPGEMGLMENFLLDWYAFLDNCETVKMNFDVSPKVMSQIIALFAPQHGKQKRKILVHGVKYLPKKFTFILNKHQIDTVQATLVKEGTITP